MRWRHILYAFLFSFLFGGMYALSGQVVADTLQVTVRGDGAGVTFESFEVDVRIGDTIQYIAQAYDSDGDPVDAAYAYASSDTTVIRIDQATGLAIALRKGVVDIWVQATVGAVMHIASFRDGELNWSGVDTIFINVWEESPGDSTWVENPNLADGGYWYMDHVLVPNPDTSLQYCAWVVDHEGYLVSQSMGPPVCPAAFPIRPPSLNRVFAHLPTFTQDPRLSVRSTAGKG